MGDARSANVVVVGRQRRAEHQVLRGRSLGVAEGAHVLVRQLRVRLLHGGGVQLGGVDAAAKEGVRDDAERVGGGDGDAVGDDREAVPPDAEEGHRANPAALQKKETGENRNHHSGINPFNGLQVCIYRPVNTSL